MYKRFSLTAFIVITITIAIVPANAAPSSKVRPAVCEVLPIAQLTNFRNDSAIECDWAVPIAVANGVMTGGIASIRTDKRPKAYEAYKLAQQQLIDTFGAEEGVTISDQSGVVNCDQSRMVVIRKKGVPTWSHFTAWCDGQAIGYVTSGAQFSTDNASKFQQIVAILVGHSDM